MPDRSRKPTPELWGKLKPIARQMRRESTPQKNICGINCATAHQARSFVGSTQLIASLWISSAMKLT